MRAVDTIELNKKYVFLISNGAFLLFSALSFFTVLSARMWITIFQCAYQYWPNDWRSAKRKWIVEPKNKKQKLSIHSTRTIYNHMEGEVGRKTELHTFMDFESNGAYRRVCDSTCKSIVHGEILLSMLCYEHTHEQNWAFKQCEKKENE